MSKKGNADEEKADGRHVEVIEQNGVRVEITRDDKGNVVDIVKRVKPAPDTREKRPMGNQSRRPV